MGTVDPSQSVIEAAVAALRAFGGELPRELAAGLLRMWHHYPSLTERETLEILARFGVTYCRECGRRIEYAGGEWQHVTAERSGAPLRPLTIKGYNDEAGEGR